MLMVVLEIGFMRIAKTSGSGAGDDETTMVVVMVTILVTMLVMMMTTMMMINWIYDNCKSIWTEDSGALALLLVQPTSWKYCQKIVNNASVNSQHKR